ncbi:MAG: permease-like cell division protein FtsX [Clostridia bacterium]|nr:permease-like cell division protein FtsX [Clostridia bacterium]
MKKSRNIRYLTHEGIKNIGTNRLMSVASIAVLMSCLVMIGSALLIFFNVDTLLQNIEDQNIIMVFVDVGSDDAAVKSVERQIGQMENIQSCEFVSKAEAYNKVLESLGSNASLLSESDDSFLPDGFRLTVRDMEQFAATVSQLQSIEHVMSVQQNTDLATKLAKVRRAVSYVSVCIIVLLFVVSLFIIANTVRITMFSRKLEISIMKAVGATNWFIRWPFLIEGLTIGIISAALGFGVLYLIYFLASDSLLAIFGLLGNSLVDFWEYAAYIAAGFVIVSIVTGGIGSVFSIGRYLKEQGSVVLDEK